jgi:hypothetical protein
MTARLLSPASGVRKRDAKSRNRTFCPQKSPVSLSKRLTFNDLKRMLAGSPDALYSH